jgi:hypothetical protein
MIMPLTVSLTPAFFYPGDFLFKAQLRCLSEQANKDFGVLVVDAHYSKRKDYMPELAAHYKLAITHVPYAPNTRVAKTLDCQIFNAPYLYSESPRIVRYSCWRFVRPDFTDACLNSKTNVDFRFHSCEAPTKELQHPETRHNVAIWDMNSDVVHWDKVPTKAGMPGATWGHDSDVDEPAGLFRRNCYGNYMVFRDQWLSINGTNEAVFSLAHYEDMDFCVRARNANLQCSRKAGKLVRMDHYYGSYSGRANITPDVEFKRPCPACEKAAYTLEPNRFDWPRRASVGEIELFERDRAWVCKTCFLCGPMYSKDPVEHMGAIESRGITQAPILTKYKIGRNLRILAGDMDGKSLQEKVEIFERSYSDERYYASA